MYQARRARWYGEIVKISLPFEVPFTYAHPLKGENEDLLLFVVPKMHQTATLNGCHRDARHQGCDCTLSLLQERFW